ncbi:hypothetical protein AMATHDRAFT_11542 [Amanita thiersii Skay4041]|uniref:Uncharacterized protein n=1 Tax=Amanita thiersii Skay4041 TaxID=703135 RepID=A0A2A9NA24_9AGAR|nr:hypothetical protein AMATHDRAFT_11542 [Amanita thiersii Skay4041]
MPSASFRPYPIMAHPHVGAHIRKKSSLVHAQRAFDPGSFSYPYPSPITEVTD